MPPGTLLILAWKSRESSFIVTACILLPGRVSMATKKIKEEYTESKASSPALAKGSSLHAHAYSEFLVLNLEKERKGKASMRDVSKESLRGSGAEFRDYPSMPDSPEGCKAQLTVSTSSGHPKGPPIALTAAGMNGSHSPHSTMNGVGPPSPTLPLGPAPSSTVGGGGAEPPSSCHARQLSKLKRFLTTLQQFGLDISPEIGERVRNLILSLVNGGLSIEEFHHKLQETTNFPLRPFVVPFLKSNLPLLQRELVQGARLAKQSPQQYLRQHEHLVLDPSPSPTDATDLFHAATAELNENGKRRGTPDSCLSQSSGRHKENGVVPSAAADSSLELPPPPKRHHPLLSPPLGTRMSPGAMALHPGATGPLRLDDVTLCRDLRDRERDRYDREYRPFGLPLRDLADEREMEDEWKNIHTMLNCILGMVEKTKRALAILQHRSLSDRHEMALWIRRHADGPDNDMKKRAGEMMAHTLKTTEDRVSEVKRRAEEAVNEVKRQAVVELQKAVSVAEAKASELVASERAKMEKLVAEARRQAAEEAVSALNRQDESTESCWNCGRKASETCSGCNVARYCGAFCQHKDWENHHHACGQGDLAPAAAPASAGSTGRPGLRAPSPQNTATPSPTPTARSSGSRSTTPVETKASSSSNGNSNSADSKH